MIGDVNRAEPVLFLPSLEELLPDDHVARLYVRVAARLDLSALEATCQTTYFLYTSATDFLYGF